jgi:predicted nucleotidyltransferase
MEGRMPETQTADLPAPVERALADVLAAARAAFDTRLKSVVLYGSAADGKLRATSDVNVIIVLDSFEQAQVDRLRDALSVAQASIGLTPMFLLESEIAAAVEAFAAKFTDVLRRRRVLHGEDPFRDVSVPRAAAIARLKQVLLNSILRLRAFYALRSLHEEQLALLVADAAGPLRSSAATLLELEGAPAPSPKEALERVAASLDDGFRESLARVSEAREKGVLPPGLAGPTLFRLMDLAQGLRARVESLK